jgi:hypothetical protein
LTPSLNFGVRDAETLLLTERATDVIGGYHALAAAGVLADVSPS